jgi:hypothetical protein
MCEVGIINALLAKLPQLAAAAVAGFVAVSCLALAAARDPCTAVQHRHLF